MGDTQNTSRTRQYEPSISSEEADRLRERAAELGLDEQTLRDTCFEVARKTGPEQLTADELVAVAAQLDEHREAA